MVECTAISEIKLKTRVRIPAPVNFKKYLAVTLTLGMSTTEPALILPLNMDNKPDRWPHCGGFLDRTTIWKSVRIPAPAKIPRNMFFGLSMIWTKKGTWHCVLWTATARVLRTI